MEALSGDLNVIRTDTLIDTLTATATNITTLKHDLQTSASQSELMNDLNENDTLKRKANAMESNSMSNTVSLTHSIEPKRQMINLPTYVNGNTLRHLTDEQATALPNAAMLAVPLSMQGMKLPVAHQLLLVPAAPVQHTAVDNNCKKITDTQSPNTIDIQSNGGNPSGSLVSMNADTVAEVAGVTVATTNHNNQNNHESTIDEQIIPETPKQKLYPMFAPETGVYYAREAAVASEEDAGDIVFRIITNDNKPQTLVWLITLKNIFAKQLPKMPREYIVRLVLDRRHKSLVLLKDNKVVGGICYRPYGPQQFAEIAFCAITSSQQVKGYGTRLMNHLKEAVKLEGLTNFLTYADNYAIGYFKKQGFSKSVNMDKSRWVGYIKDYDGGTLMECVIRDSVDYLNIPKLLDRQREMVCRKILEMTKSTKVYEGLRLTAQGGGSYSTPYDIPGVRECGWKPPAHSMATSSRHREQNIFKQDMFKVLSAVDKHHASWPFTHPVNTANLVDYLDVINVPMDLSLIRERLELSDHYKTKTMFKDDLILMCNNCREYNPPDTKWHKCADDLQMFIEDLLREDTDGPVAVTETNKDKRKVVDRVTMNSSAILVNTSGATSTGEENALMQNLNLNSPSTISTITINTIPPTSSTSTFASVLTPAITVDVTTTNSHVVSDEDVIRAVLTSDTNSPVIKQQLSNQVVVDKNTSENVLSRYM